MRLPDCFDIELEDVKALRDAGITHVAYVDDKGTVVRTEDVTKPKARAAAAKPAAADPAPTTAVAPTDAVTAAGAVEPAPSAVVDAEAVSA